MELRVVDCQYWKADGVDRGICQTGHFGGKPHMSVCAACPFKKPGVAVQTDPVKLLQVKGNIPKRVKESIVKAIRGERIGGCGCSRNNT